MYKEYYKTNLDSMFKFADNCTEALLLSREAFFSLYENYNDLETEAKSIEDTVIKAKSDLKSANLKTEEEKGKRVIWKRVALGEGIVLVGAITGLVTGAWVPVVAVVVVCEVALILNKEAPKISFKKLLFKT